MYAKKKNLKIILIVGLGVILVVGVSWVGIKIGQKKEASQVKTNQKDEIEKQLQQLKNQLQKETDPTKKQELEKRKKDLEQQVRKLGSSNTPLNPPTIPPTPSQNPPTKNPSQKTSRQFTVENNGKVGDKWEFINVDNSQERILIDSENKLFYSNVAFYIKGGLFTISFNEEDATEKKEIKQTIQTLIRYIFDKNSDKFQLTPIANSPSPGNGNNNKMDLKLLPQYITNGELYFYAKYNEKDDGKGGKT